MKKSVILLVLMFVAISAQADDYFRHGGVRYKIESFVDQELRVTYPDEPDYNTRDLVIPGTIRTKQGQVWTVTAIGDGAFTKYSFDAGYKNLRSVSIPKTVKTIHPDAFKGCKLEELTLDCPARFNFFRYLWDERVVLKVVHLGANATPETCDRIASSYKDNLYVKKVTLNPANKKLSMVNGVIYNKAKTEIIYVPRDAPFSLIVPKTVKSIREYVFEGSPVTSVILSSIDKIDKNMFFRCKNLTSITIPNSVLSIGERAFQDCSSLKNIKLPNGIKKIEFSTFQNSGIESISLPESLESIANLAFCDCKNLKSITIPSLVKSIGDRAFCDCEKLEKIVIPESVVKFHHEAVFWSKALKYIYCYAKTPQFKFPFYADYSNYNPLEIHIPRGCKSAYERSDWKRANITFVDDL